jgi:hypothetical protein
MSDLFLPSLPSKGSRDNTGVWQRSIAETFPFLARVAVVGLGNAWRELLAWADVENSARWQPRRTAGGNNATFCNLYAWDIGKQLHPEFSDVIPALWFNKRGIQQVRGGTFTKVEYAENVVAVGANGLADWFAKFGAEFGWTVIPATIENEPEIQDAVNRGALGYITCANVNRSRAGHVAVVVHDDAGRDVPGEGLLQSQAGSTNYELRRSRWYTARSFNTVGADGKPTKGRRMFAYKFL